MNNTAKMTEIYADLARQYRNKLLYLLVQYRCLCVCNYV